MTLVIDFGEADRQQGCHWLKDYRDKKDAERAANPPKEEADPGYELDMTQPIFQKLRREGKLADRAPKP